MASDAPISKSAFADVCNVDKSTLSHWLSEGKIGPEAIVGTGRSAKIIPSVALKHLRMRMDVGQRLGNGSSTRLHMPKPSAPAPEPVAAPQPVDAPEFDPALDEQIKREKLHEIQGRNRKAQAEEEARIGRYMLTEDARREMNAVAKRLVGMFESALTELASSVVARHGSDPREELLFLSEAFMVWRAQMAERAQKAADALPKFIDPAVTAQETP